VNYALQHRGCALHFDKLHFLRRFEENDRIVLVWSDCRVLSSKKLQYRTLGYTAITPSAIAPLGKCTVHTTLQLEMVCAKGGSGTFKEAQELALGALSRMMRSFWQDEQNRLVEEASRAPPAPLQIAV
jgi:hypothetical protein